MQTFHPVHQISQSVNKNRLPQLSRRPLSSAVQSPSFMRTMVIDNHVTQPKVENNGMVHSTSTLHRRCKTRFHYNIKRRPTMRVVFVHHFCRLLILFCISLLTNRDIFDTFYTRKQFYNVSA